MTVTIIIPTKNEERTIEKIIARVKKYGDEILVVDGHSGDKTRTLAEEHGARVVLDHGKGKGDGIRVGIQEARGDIIVFIDADGSHDPDDIPELIRPIQEGTADLVVGSRGKGGSDELHGDVEKLLRMIGSDIILIGINKRWKVHLTDSQNGYRAIRTDVARQLNLKENITTIEQEMTMKCLKKGFRVDEVPTHEYMREHGESVIRLKKVWFRYIWSFLKNLI
ncbi:MAG: glycosyltransferase family 2 protein [Candidatus Aminicenantes bacterium]|nr:glycosyltransferase family 2 protein [Candidatus Aminicenantes bacterium]